MPMSKGLAQFWHTPNNDKRRSPKLMFGTSGLLPWASTDMAHIYSGPGPMDSFGIDIGGSLLKISYFINNSWNHRCFKVSDYKDAFSFLQETLDRFRVTTLFATGGGSIRLYNELQACLSSSRIVLVDEMAALVSGIVAMFRGKLNFPFLILHAGSGVSMLHVESAEKFQRVSGTSLGGGTFCGLSKLLTGINEFEELLERASLGSNKRVDLLVSDIYGQDYTTVGLPADIPASSFGRIQSLAEERPSTNDLIYSLLLMLCNNLSQMAMAYSKMYGLCHVVFSGGLFDSNELSCRLVVDAIEFLSHNQTSISFALPAMFVGSMGAACKLYEESCEEPINLASNVDTNAK